MTSVELIELLEHENKWYRQTALRLLGDRRDSSIIPLLREQLAAATGQRALETLWALNLSGGLDELFALELLKHAEPQVQLWTIRLECDDNVVSSEFAAALTELAESEPDVLVRSQLASSARRVSAENGLPILAALLRRDEDAEDIHLPLLLYWGLEAHAETGRNLILSMLEDRSLWNEPIMADFLLERLMQRYAVTGTRQNLLTCAKLLEMAPDDASKQALMKGFEQAFRGRSLASIPAELGQALTAAGGGSLTLRLRQRDPAAISETIEQLETAATASLDDKSAGEITELVITLGEVAVPEALPALLQLLDVQSHAAVRRATLTALGAYAEPEIAQRVIAGYDSFDDETRAVAQSLLVSRGPWTLAFLQAIDAGRVAAESVPVDVVRLMTIHGDEEVAELISQHWSDIEGASTAEMQEQIQRLSSVVKSTEGDPYHGKTLFDKTCGKCHILFGEGGRIGPNLTTYKRDDVFNILVNVVNPSAEIREGFESVVVITDEGRTASGFLFDQDDQVVVIRGADGQNVTFERESIEEMLPLKKSLMPEGLLRDLSEKDVSDLFAYLRASQPLNQ